VIERVGYRKSKREIERKRERERDGRKCVFVRERERERKGFQAFLSFSITGVYPERYNS